MKAPEGASQVDQDMPQQCCDHACPLYFTSQVDAVQPSDQPTDTCCCIGWLLFPSPYVNSMCWGATRVPVAMPQQSSCHSARLCAVHAVELGRGVA
jgi:hypothetical protein